MRPLRPLRPLGWTLALLAFLSAMVVAAPPPPALPPGIPGTPAAPALRLDVALAQGQATVGDRVEALLTLRLPTAQLAGEPRFPTWNQGWGEAEVVEKGEPAKISEAGGTTVYRQRIALTAWKPGRVALPPVAAAVPLRGATVQAASPGNLALTVASVLPPKKEGAKDPAPKPEAPPRPLPLGAPFGWSTLALAAACGGLGYLLWRRSRKVGSAAAVPALAPLAELLAGLERLGGEPSVSLHTRLSLVLRTYLGRTLAFPAAESTTSEIYRRLLARQLPSAFVRRTFELLRACDLVKFARQEVSETVSRERLSAAREIGGELAGYLAPPATEATDAGNAGNDSPRLEKTG
jgi:hypothetical protein